MNMNGLLRPGRGGGMHQTRSARHLDVCRRDTYTHSLTRRKRHIQDTHKIGDGDACMESISGN